MERSKSCSNFDTSLRNKINKNNNNSNGDGDDFVSIIRSSSSMKSLTQHHSKLLQKQLQLQHQQLQYNGSADDLKTMLEASIRSTCSIAKAKATPIASGNVSSLPRYSALRKKQFHRQVSSACASSNPSPRDRFHDDTDYHADLEDDAPELQREHRLHFAVESERTSFCSHHKQQLFAHHKPQSDSILMMMNSAAASERRLRHEDSFDSTATVDPRSPASQRRHRFASYLTRDSSVSQSDSSRYSSVDSLLESRKPDPEAILINLGFGPVGSEDILSRIPKRFLKPSQVRGIDTEAFVKRLQLASHLADNSVLGYRGLTGNPDVPPSSIVAKIMARFEVNQRKKSMGGIE